MSRSFLFGYLVCMLLIIHVSVQISNISVPCVLDIKSNETICSCSADGLYTNCSGRNLSHIPKVPNTTQFLNLSGNVINSIDTDVLQNNVPVHELKSLDMSKNNISVVEMSSLKTLSTLNVLNVSSNPLDAAGLNNITTNISRNLKTLIVEGLNLVKFPYNIMDSIRGITLLSLKNNSISDVNGSRIFQFIPRIQRLDLSYNAIRDIEIAYSKHLEELSLSANDLTYLPNCCRPTCNDNTCLPNLQSLFLDYNCIKKLDMPRLNCLDQVSLLNISAISVRVIETNTFSSLKSLKALTLEETESLQQLKPYAFNSSSLQTLYIKFNYVFFISEYVDVKTIFGPNNGLKRLDLSGNKLGYLRAANWTTLLKHQRNLTYLDISKSELLYLPKVIPTYLQNLESLHCAENGIHFISKDYFKPLKKLKILFLNNNQLTQITADILPPSLTNTLKFLNLQYNPYVCDCRLVWFINFAKKHPFILARYPHNYECADRTLIANTNITKKACLLANNTAVIIQSTIVSMILLLCIMSAVYRFRWRLRYAFFVLRYRRRKYFKLLNTCAPRIHDVYVSCSESDFDEVHRNIVCKMENIDINVFVPQRDAIPGTMIIQQALDDIDRSKHVLLCLSDSYAQDHWREFEACMAYERSVHEGPDENSLHVLILGEIDSVNMTGLFNRLIRTDDCIKWDTSIETNDLFWRKLMIALQLDPESQITNTH